MGFLCIHILMKKKNLFHDWHRSNKPWKYHLMISIWWTLTVRKFPNQEEPEYKVYIIDKYLQLVQGISRESCYKCQNNTISLQCIGILGSKVKQQFKKKYINIIVFLLLFLLNLSLNSKITISLKGSIYKLNPKKNSSLIPM